MNKTLLTNEQFIREAGNLSDNIQPKFLLPAIRETQEIDLQGVLGTTLYQTLIDKVEQGTISGKYKELLDRAQYFILYSVITKLIYIANFKIDNLGAYQTNDENAYSLSFKDIISLADYYTNKADYYKLDLQRYLAGNYNEFPELTKGDCSRIHSNLYSAATSGIYLGGARGKRSRYPIPTYGYDILTD